MTEENPLTEKNLIELWLRLLINKTVKYWMKSPLNGLWTF